MPSPPTSIATSLPVVGLFVGLRGGASRLRGAVVAEGGLGTPSVSEWDPCAPQGAQNRMQKPQPQQYQQLTTSTPGKKWSFVTICGGNLGKSRKSVGIMAIHGLAAHGSKEKQQANPQPRSQSVHRNSPQQDHSRPRRRSAFPSPAGRGASSEAPTGSGRTPRGLHLEEGGPRGKISFLRAASATVIPPLSRLSRSASRVSRNQNILHGPAADGAGGAASRRSDPVLPARPRTDQQFRSRQVPTARGHVQRRGAFGAAHGGRMRAVSRAMGISTIPTRAARTPLGKRAWAGSRFAAK